MVFKCQKNEVHSLTLEYHCSRCTSHAGFLSFNKFELSHSKEDNCCSWTFVPPNYNNCVTFEWGKFKLAKQQDSNIQPTFPMFRSKD
ncbi:hypothetical protein MTR_8g101420 [Medicago truncatula]|uniref:Uncharacterized protein n=1 Tax=Medicago truncatula TaxID=3880 RepID=G7LIW5_MEDTR|nr:hypothetical protein MTR_8g101420 [Medicago truncatula]